MVTISIDGQVRLGTHFDLDMIAAYVDLHRQPAGPFATASNYDKLKNLNYNKK